MRPHLRGRNHRRDDSVVIRPAYSAPGRCRSTWATVSTRHSRSSSRSSRRTGGVSTSPPIGQARSEGKIFGYPDDAAQRTVGAGRERGCGGQRPVQRAFSGALTSRPPALLREQSARGNGRIRHLGIVARPTHDYFGGSRRWLGSGVDSTAGDFGRSYFENDDLGIPTLFLASSRPGVGGVDIYRSELTITGSFGSVTLVAELRAPQSDFRPTIRFDGLEAIFDSQPSRVTGHRRSGSARLWDSTRSSL